MAYVDHKILFYVVQFLDLPFKKIDEYVCVPSSWVILGKPKNKGNVTYPNNEDPSDTRGRVKRREKPNDDWRFYPVLIKYESQNYKNAKDWILRNRMINDYYYESDEEELGIRDTQRKPEQNKEPRREIQPCSSCSNSDKPELTLKTYSSPRKPQLLLSQKRDENLNKLLKLDENHKPGIVTDHITAASGCSKQEQSIIITGNQVIQKDQTKTSSDSNGKVNTDRNTQSAVVKEKQSVKMSIQSILSKLLTKQQHSHQPPTEQHQLRQPPTEQQQSRQPPADREPSLQPPIDQQPDDSTDTQSTQLAQHHLHQAQGDDSRMNDVRPIMSQRDPLPHNITNMTPTLDQKVCHQNAMMTEGFVLQSQPNPINQPIQVLPQNGNQYTCVHAQEVKRHELMKRSTEKAHIVDKAVAQKEVNIQSTAHNSSSQSHQHAEHPQQKQFQLNYRDPPTTNTQNSLLLRLKRSSDNPKPQRITKRSRSLLPSNTSSQTLLDAQRSSFIQELGIQERVNQSSTTCNNMNLAAVSESHQSNHDYQHPHMKKNMIAQATETNSMMDVDHSVETIAGSTILVESARQTDEWLRKEQALFCKETASDSENPSEHEIELNENEIVPETNQTILTAGQNLTPGNKHVQSRVCNEQDTMDEFSTLLTQMGATSAFAIDKIDCLRNSILTCAQTYETLLKKITKFNSIKPHQIFKSPPNNVISQVTQGRPVRDNDNATIQANATTSIREQTGTFSLPAEYDPNDTKWTLKYREIERGLVELMPQTGVYIKRKELQRCIRASNDCRTLARLLLTKVFSQNALRVCSWTGGKAKAFGNIDVRPGLDENARMVLLTFVEEHGKKRGWSTVNTSAVMSTIRTKINDIRAKYEQTCKA